MDKKLLFLILLLTCFTRNSQSQGNAGREFWVAFLDPDEYCTFPPPDTGQIDDSLELFISSPHAATVQIVNGTSATLKLTPNIVQHYKLSSLTACRTFYSDRVTNNNGVQILADSNIFVIAVNRFHSTLYKQSKGATSLIPSESIPYGPEYIVTTNQSDHSWGCYGGFQPVKSPEFVIVGVAPVSYIEVTSLGQSTARPLDRVGKPFAIRLLKGETFFFISRSGDLSGSLVRSKDTTSKFMVFTGNRVTGSDTISGSNCADGDDHTFEQLPPTVYSGTSYSALPFKNLKGGYFLKIMGSQENCSVSINGQYTRTINEGEHFIYNVSTDTVTRITSDKAITVAQFTKGTACGQHLAPKTRLGDISQVMLIPDTLYATIAMVNFARPFKNYQVGPVNMRPEDFINVTVKATDTSSFTINNKKVMSSQWKTAPAIKGYVYAQLRLDSLNNTLKSSKGFRAYVYGYDVERGYAYSAGANYRHIRSNFVYDKACQLDSTIFIARETDSFKNYSWNFGDNSQNASGLYVKHRYFDTGWHMVRMYFRHKRTNLLDSVTKKIFIAFNGWNSTLWQDTLICGKMNFGLYAMNFNMDNSYLWQDGHTNYGISIKKAGRYWVTVTERNFCSYTDTVHIRNHPYPIANFQPSDTVICFNRNRPISFTNLSTSPDTVIVSNKWNFGGADTLDNNLYIRNLFPQPGKHNAKLTVETRYGCKDDTVRIINIASAPEAGFQVSNFDSCFNGNTLNITNTSISDSALHKGYKWFFSEGFFFNNANPSNPWNYALPGKYSVLLVYENKFNCVDSAKRDITIYEHPKSAVTFTDPHQCEKDSILFINNTTSKYQPVKSLWSFGDMQTDTTTSPLHFYSAKGTYNLKLISESPQGCKDSMSLALRIRSAPKADFSINDTQQCQFGNYFDLKNTSTTDTAGFIYKQWLYDDTSMQVNIDNASKSFLYPRIHKIQLLVTNIFGCSDTVIKTVEVKKTPDIRFKINAASQCFNGHSFDLDYLPQQGNAAITQISWYYKTDSSKNVNSINNIRYPSYGQYPVRLRLLDVFGCFGEMTRNVSVNPEPFAGFDSISPQCLQGNSFTFKNNSTVPSGTVSDFKWDFGDLSSSIVRHPIGKSYTSGGVYKVTLVATSDSGCTDTASSMLTVHPNANITILPVKSVCLNDSALFTANVSVASGSITSYLWEFGDLQTSSNMISKHMYASPGTYNIILSTTTDKGCIDSKTANSWVTVHDLPKPDFKYKTMDGGNRNTIITFTDITLPKPNNWLWDFNNFGKSIKSDTSISITDSATIRARLYVTDKNGCTGMVEKYIFGAPPSIVFTPNVFSPNGDGHNDRFGPAGTEFSTNYTFRIFNRWGEIIFESSTPGETWDGTYQGKLCPVGLYHYHVQLNDFNGIYKTQDGMVLMKW